MFYFGQSDMGPLILIKRTASLLHLTQFIRLVTALKPTKSFDLYVIF